MSRGFNDKNNTEKRKSDWGSGKVKQWSTKGATFQEPRSQTLKQKAWKAFLRRQKTGGIRGVSRGGLVGKTGGKGRRTRAGANRDTHLGGGRLYDSKGKMHPKRGMVLSVPRVSLKGGFAYLVERGGGKLQTSPNHRKNGSFRGKAGVLAILKGLTRV